MTALPKKKLTVQEYLTIERAAAFKSDLYQGEMFPIAGVSITHNRVKENLIGELGFRLESSSCQSFSSDQRVAVDATGFYTYPDILIVCGRIKRAELDADTITNPKVIFEVLSDSTERYDRHTKFRHYSEIAALSEYVLVSQSDALIERFTRRDDGTWTFQVFFGLEAEFSLASIPVAIPLSDIYRGVEFPPAEIPSS
jgi:Uma2 family endonuclease